MIKHLSKYSIEWNIWVSWIKCQLPATMQIISPCLSFLFRLHTHVRGCISLSPPACTINQRQFCCWAAVLKSSSVCINKYKLHSSWVLQSWWGSEEAAISNLAAIVPWHPGLVFLLLHWLDRTSVCFSYCRLCSFDLSCWYYQTLFSRAGHDRGIIHSQEFYKGFILQTPHSKRPWGTSAEQALAALSQQQQEHLREELFGATSPNLSEQSGSTQQHQPRLSKSSNLCSPSPALALDTTINAVPQSGKMLE